MGFFSYYDHILPKDATRVFVIKGGPGVGKSTFMTNIARDMVDLGYDVEIHHCSSDNNSVDGVVFPAIGVGLVDGTEPHVVDPKVPGAVDEIIWLGEFWDEDSVRANKPQILQCQKGIESVFKRAYRYLKAAQVVYEDWESVNMEAMDYGKANMIAARVIEETMGSVPVASSPGTERKLFASAITPDGMVNYLNTIVAPCKNRYVIQGEPGTGKSVLLEKVKRAAVERGFFVEAYYCPLHPEKVEHVVVPGLSLVLTKSIHPHTYVPGPTDTIIDMDQCLDQTVIESHRDCLELAQKAFASLFETAINYISKAKQYHDALERYYAPNMDFASIDRLRKKTLDRILGYASEVRGAAGTGDSD
ncbi:MAG TPA: ATPase [Firmicutes bacterium]|nr:ATPase [Candidatus Fermentithermobacillaceae bacterium]